MDANSLKIITALKAARIALNWTQQTLAAKCGVSQVSIARMESGIVSPRLSNVSKIRAALLEAGVRIVDESPEGGFTLIVDGKVFRVETPAAAE
ncbi:MAG: helix-turn-helix domain-containing protein [Azonexus sp.]|nr:helix-turn-helix transcriptional regulator [Azonexus sp.]MCK6413156.1 helix-turn-helix domain-containing protein [Azonexus sp.]